ncbi:cytochrome c oxidase subunit II [Chondromyces apiculatus]|uniref:cytochrome-c oxidase n=1 Tax=Chondromyces apiculatus DSM 436 TaxID=1192034 RepID=A0A017TDN3_9BACT|nr:cytochrome c oxidase subunit II [Chondromyces apiculatus]EYF06920.1 Cytochrome c oxidase polypeptide II [Chondromyces apiculatus DSM 436]
MNELLRRLLFLPPQRSTVAAEIDGLHFLVITITMVGATAVALAGGYFLFKYRRRAEMVGKPNPGATSRPALLVEIVVLVLLGALFLWLWLIGYRQYMRLAVPPEDALDVYVMGKQWMWKFAYPHGAASVTDLYVPAGRPVRLTMTSRDVLHSFFVPDFRIKQDVVPGRYTTVWFQATEPGTYQILCTEYCGTEHSYMRGQVVALGPEDYARWRADGEKIVPREPSLKTDLTGRVEKLDAPREAQAAQAEQTMAWRGQRVAAEQGCLRCHTLDGTRHIGPTFAGLYGRRVPLESGGEAVVDEAFITASIMDPVREIHLGFSPVMPSYLGRIAPPDVAAIVELIRSLRRVEPAEGALEEGIRSFDEEVAAP